MKKFFTLLTLLSALTLTVGCGGEATPPPAADAAADGEHGEHTHADGEEDAHEDGHTDGEEADAAPPADGEAPADDAAPAPADG